MQSFVFLSILILWDGFLRSSSLHSDQINCFFDKISNNSLHFLSTEMSTIDTWNITLNFSASPVNQSCFNETSATQSNLSSISVNQLQSVVLDFFAVFMTIVAVVGCIVNLMILVLFTKWVYNVVCLEFNKMSLLIVSIY